MYVGEIAAGSRRPGWCVALVADHEQKILDQVLVERILQLPGFDCVRVAQAQLPHTEGRPASHPCPSADQWQPRTAVPPPGADGAVDRARCASDDLVAERIDQVHPFDRHFLRYAIGTREIKDHLLHADVLEVRWKIVAPDSK